MSFKTQIMRHVLPVFEQQLKRVQPWFYQMTDPEAMFPLNWDVDSKDASKYKVKLNVKEFKPENIKIKVVENKVVVEGDHNEKTTNKEMDSAQTSISRYFIAEFRLPNNVNPKDVESSVKDGFVTISASKKVLPKHKN